MPEEKEEKKPLDMTTDEALDYLFPKEVVDHLKGVAGKNEQPPPTGDDNGAKMKGRSTRKHDNT